jgi:hypothetical protein
MLSRLLVAMSSLAVVSVVACSSSTSSTPGGSGCNTNPFSCPAGQTCWPNDTSGTFACLNSAAGVTKGSSCQNYPGTPTCGDGMFCLQTTTVGGTCVTYCDPSNAAHGCSAGEICTPVALAGNASAQVHVCYNGGVGPDGGAGDSGANDSGNEAAPPDDGGDGGVNDGASNDGAPNDAPPG